MSDTDIVAEIEMRAGRWCFMEEIDGQDWTQGSFVPEDAAKEIRALREALEKIKRGEIDEGGTRRECENAGAIARAALSPAAEE